jgi:DNA-binding LytR/AlgR family response regulator
MCDRDNLSILKANEDLRKEIEKNSIELEIGNRILMSEPDIARAGYFMEQILYKISNSLTMMKSSINMISIHNTDDDSDDNRRLFTCMKSVEDFYNALSIVADSIVETIDPDNIKYFMEPVNTNNTDKLLEKVSTIYKRFADAAKQLVTGDEEAVEIKEEQDLRNIDKIVAWDNEEMLVFHLSDVLYFTSEGGNTVVNTKNGAFKMRDTLDILENRLSVRNFFRCHRSFLINLDHVTKITPWIGRNYILNLNGSSDEIPVSRNRLNEIKRLLGAG